MTRIALVTPCLTTADAISNDVYGMSDTLKSKGHDVRLFAQENTAKGIQVFGAKEVVKFLKDPDDILIYHYSMGWDYGLALLKDLKCQKAIKYHNITPPEYFSGVSNEYERVCEVGRNQIKDIAHSECDVYLADSDYNLGELLIEGVDPAKSFVVAPFHHVDRLEELAPDTTVLNGYAMQKVKVLMVGRVVPNKGHTTLIEAFSIYRNEYNRDAILFVVGKEPDYLESYSLYLRQLVSDLRLDGAVVFTGVVSDEQLKTYYLLSDVFMMLSEHEGFCVPLVEAMAMKVPIVACATSAIPGTIGRAGLLWNERDPYLLAESINFLVQNEPSSVALGLMGRSRYESSFSNERIAADFLVALSNLRAV